MEELVYRWQETYGYPLMRHFGKNGVIKEVFVQGGSTGVAKRLTPEALLQVR